MGATSRRILLIAVALLAGLPATAFGAAGAGTSAFRAPSGGFRGVHGLHGFGRGFGLRHFFFFGGGGGGIFRLVIIVVIVAVLIYRQRQNRY